MKKIHWGIIGCGDVTEVKSGPGFQKARGSELVAVMRRNGKLAKDYAKRHGVPRWYDNANSLICDPEIDAVYIATPPAFHKQYTIMCAHAKKHVYVEKPMAVNYAQCVEMLETCKNEGVSLYVAYYRRGLEYFKKIKELCNSGAIGKVRAVNLFISKTSKRIGQESNKSNWRLSPEISGGGLFYDIAPHILDILDYIIGPISHANGITFNQTGLAAVDDFVGCYFEFECGAAGVGEWIFNSPKDFEQNRIIGSEGWITFSNSMGSFLLENVDGIKEYSFDNPETIQQQLIQSITDELLGIGKSLSTGDTAIRTSRVIDEIMGISSKQKSYK